MSGTRLTGSGALPWGLGFTGKGCPENKGGEEWSILGTISSILPAPSTHTHIKKASLAKIFHPFLPCPKPSSPGPELGTSGGDENDARLGEPTEPLLLSTAGWLDPREDADGSRWHTGRWPQAA